MSIPKAILGTAFILMLGVTSGMLSSTLIATNAYKEQATEQVQSDRTLRVTGSVRRRIQSAGPSGKSTFSLKAPA